MTLRVIMVGKSGDGKSSTGNTLLRQQLFRAESSAGAVTNHCQVETDNAIGFTIVDTPGLCDNNSSFTERALEVQKSLELCEQPHAFLLVFKMDRFTTDDFLVGVSMPIIFGEKVFDHCIIVFTHGCQNCHRKEPNQNSTDGDFGRGSDEYVERNAQPCKDEELRLFWSKDEELANIIKRCNYRVLRIENDYRRQCHIHTTDIVTKQIRDEVNLVSKQGNQLYSYPYIKEHRKVLEKHMTTHFDNHLEAIRIMRTNMNTKLTEIQRKEKVKYFIYGVCAVGFSSFTVISVILRCVQLYTKYRQGIVKPEEIEVVANVIQAALSASSKKDIPSIIIKELSVVSQQCIEKIAQMATSNTSSKKLQKALSSGNIKWIAEIYLFWLCKQAIKTKQAII